MCVCVYALVCLYICVCAHVRVFKSTKYFDPSKSRLKKENIEHLNQSRSKLTS